MGIADSLASLEARIADGARDAVPLAADPVIGVEPPQVGMRVLVHSMRALEHGGRLGKILSVDGERAGVLLDDAPKPISIKVVNLFVLRAGPPPPGDLRGARAPTELG